MSEKKPWTAIIRLNEEYFIALEERVKLLGIKGDSRVLPQLPITRYASRKFAFPSKAQPLSGGRPWESWVERVAVSLSINYDVDEPQHNGFNLQEQAKIDSERGLHAVFLDYIELEIMIEHKKYRVKFKLKRIPQDSETLRETQRVIELYEEKYGLYSDPSDQAQQLYKRIFRRPSCLEICDIIFISSIPLFLPKSITSEYLSGTTTKAQEFMRELFVQTQNVVGVYYKRYDETARGWVLDGRVEF